MVCVWGGVGEMWRVLGYRGAELQTTIFVPGVSCGKVLRVMGGGRELVEEAPHTPAHFLIN